MQIVRGFLYGAGRETRSPYRRRHGSPRFQNAIQGILHSLPLTAQILVSIHLN